MGKQTMLVSVHEDETRIALTDNNILAGLHVEQTARERTVGNIYKGRIVKINPAFQAAFIDYGEPKNGFLSISDVNFNLHQPRGKEDEKGRPRIQSVLKEGQNVMVQILKEGMGNKGSAMTTFVSLPGRFMVVSPNSDRSGVSRRIEDQDTRRQLKEVTEALGAGDNLGIIVRTAGTDRPVAELKKDLETLRKEWRAIESKYEKLKRPGLLYKGPPTIVRVLRDFFTNDVQEVWVDDAEGFQEALRYFKSTMPRFQKRLKLYVGEKSLFSAYHIEEQIESLDSSQVPLPSGGSLVIESTEALVSVDVNSGRSNRADDIEETALHTNLEAVAEVSRQLRLRNLGGLIVLDFIDMMQSKNRHQVEKAMADAMKEDKARTTIGSISQFGLLELSRQRIDTELSRGLRVQCPNCLGTGHIPTANTSANNVLRKLRELAASGKYREIHGSLPLDSANHLLNDKREALRDLEQEFEIVLKLEVDPSLPAGHSISLHGQKDGGERAEEEEYDGGADVREAADESEGRKRSRRRGRGRGRPDEYDQKAAAPTSSNGVSFKEEDEPEEDHEEILHEEDVLVAESTQEADEPKEDSPSRRGGRGRGRDRGRDRDRPRDRDQGGEESPAQGQKAQAPREPLPPSENNGGGSKGSGEILFRSEHIVTDQAAVDKLPPRRSPRSNPLGAMGEKAKSNTVVYDSSKSIQGAPPSPENGKAEESAKPKRGRGGRKKPAPVEAVETASIEEVDGNRPDDVNGNVIEDVNGNVAEVRAPARKGRSRGRGRSKSGNARTDTSPAQNPPASGSAAAAPADGKARKPSGSRRRGPSSGSRSRGASRKPAAGPASTGGSAD